MDIYQKYLQASSNLYAKLEHSPKEDARETFIEEVTRDIDKLEVLSKELIESGFVYDASKREHEILYALDGGIRKRLNILLNNIKAYMRDLQNAKKNEVQYANPYGHVQSMDGMYYDKKK